MPLRLWDLSGLCKVIEADLPEDAPNGIEHVLRRELCLVWMISDVRADH